MNPSTDAVPAPITPPPPRFVIRNGWLFVNDLRLRLSSVDRYRLEGAEVSVSRDGGSRMTITPPWRNGDVWDTGARELIAALDAHFGVA